MLWWFLIVLLLFAIRTHERLMALTSINFSVTLSGKEIPFEASATLDGNPTATGQLISLGKHTFTISHPKGEPFTTNLSTWYGGHNLGNIDLKRAMGTLAVEVSPAALLVTVHGPILDFVFTNSLGMTSSVPTDHYQIEAIYPHTRHLAEAEVSANTTRTVLIKPRLGTLDLTCNQTNASFQIQKDNGQPLEEGRFPATLTDIPEGNYKVFSNHRQSRNERTVQVNAGVTNTIEVRFDYGAIEILTEPAEARVITADGRDLGTTPLNLSEIPAGKLQVKCVLNGFEPVSFSFEVVAGKTNLQQAKLLSINYGKSLEAAQQFLAALDYDNAFAAATAALQAKPNDPAALALQKDAYVKLKIGRARVFGTNRNYTSGISELEGALKQVPDNEDIKQLLGEFRDRGTEQAEQKRQLRLERPKQVFEALSSRFPDSSLFETHELKNEKPVTAVRAAIVNALKQQRPFQITRNESTAPETFEIEAQQDTLSALSTIAGRRKCLIVGGQTRDNETQILFKVLEYKTEAVEKFSIGALIGTPGEVKFVPIHSSRIPNMTEKLQAQVAYGVSNVVGRMKGVTDH